jgi:peptidyl-prolyl cis-trans isomerase A (cyclophilin A)
MGKQEVKMFRSAKATIFLIPALLTTALLTAGPAWGESENPVVRLETSLGNIDIEVYPDRAPETVANFLDLVDGGFYEGLIFHRVLAGFVIQTGGYDENLTYRQPPRTVVNESANGLRNQKFSVAMARLADPDSADSQFYINVKHNPTLDGDRTQPGYTVFGQVIAGQETVTAIELMDTRLEAGMAGVPEQDVIITRVHRL